MKLNIFTSTAAILVLLSPPALAQTNSMSDMKGMDMSKPAASGDTAWTNP